MDNVRILQKLIDESDNIVFFGGAGVSTESGIKDFRSVDGLYNMKYKYPPEIILSHNFFINNTEEFYEFYKSKMNCIEAKPNCCHNYLKRLEDKGKLKTIITQNIDGLHSKAGNKNILELHGSIYRNFCTKCHKSFTVEKIFSDEEIIPKCDCGGIIKPDVVLYNEQLNNDIVSQAIEYISKCDLLIIAGTSLTVFPASSLIDFFHGKNIVIINKDQTSYDRRATLVINDYLKNIFAYLK